jgi:HK97 gp10 family phage protein
MADVEGLDDLLKKMDGLKLSMQKTLIVRALRKGSEPVKVRGAERAPDDPDTSGNRIADNMMITISEQTADGAIAKIGPSYRDGAWVGKFSERGTARERRRPWLGPAFEETKDEAVKLIGENLAEGIEKELK